VTPVREITLGALVFAVARIAGIVVYVVVRGLDDAHRGVLEMTASDWNAMVLARDRLVAGGVVADHWNAQDGVNAAYVDRLADLHRNDGGGR
jgi:hypothetical protein